MAWKVQEDTLSCLYCTLSYPALPASLSTLRYFIYGDFSRYLRLRNLDRFHAFFNLLNHFGLRPQVERSLQP